MKFHSTSLKDAYLIEADSAQDDRGIFQRTYCQREMSSHGVDLALVQINTSFNFKKGTVRGMHFQAEPHAEAKWVRCLRGRVHDVIVDLRPTSSTFKKQFIVELFAGDNKTLFIPQGFAHGFQTLEDNSELLYLMSEFYHPDLARGFRWNDPQFQISWPLPISVISKKDESYEDYPR